MFGDTVISVISIDITLMLSHTEHEDEPEHEDDYFLSRDAG